jgi:cation transport regulator ChaB
MIRNRELFLSLVHDLRVNPWDIVTCHALADMLEEDGRPGAPKRTGNLLREGKIVLNSLDTSAYEYVEALQFRSVVRNRDLYSIQRINNQWNCCRFGGVPKFLTPVLHWELWRLVYRYRNQFNISKETYEEARKVRHDRRERGVAATVVWRFVQREYELVQDDEGGDEE